MPNSGRCVSVYICVILYIVSCCGNRQFRPCQRYTDEPEFAFSVKVVFLREQGLGIATSEMF